MLRYKDVLERRYSSLLHYLGYIIIGISILTILPALASIFWSTEVKYAVSFVLPSFICFIIGYALAKLFHNYGESAPSIEEGGVLVILSWTSAILLSSLPFIISGRFRPLQALFEAVSGWTTTGLTVFDVSATPKVFLLWRSLMQFTGGAGIAVIMLSAIVGPKGLGLYEAEGRTDQLLPNIRRSASLIMRIYTGYIAAGIILYSIAGMPLFDAINHSLTALSTGGFSTKPSSIGGFDSTFLELITIVLMLLGTTNFVIHYLLIRGRFKQVIKQGEYKLLAILLAFFIPFIFIAVTLPLYGSVTKALKITVFNTVSALSTTGFATVNFHEWPDSGVFAIIILMLIGGGAGSTAGGIKLHRVYIWAKSFIWDVRRHFLPNRALFKPYVWRGEHRLFVSDKDIRESEGYIVLYIATYLLGVLALVAQRYPLRDAAFEFASALGTVGLSVGLTGPDSPPALLITEMIAMVLGRLEFLVIFFAILKIIRDTRFIKRN